MDSKLVWNLKCLQTLSGFVSWYLICIISKFQFFFGCCFGTDFESICHLNKHLVLVCHFNTRICAMNNYFKVSFPRTLLLSLVWVSSQEQPFDIQPSVLTNPGFHKPWIFDKIFIFVWFFVFSPNTAFSFCSFTLLWLLLINLFFQISFGQNNTRQSWQTI